MLVDFSEVCCIIIETFLTQMQEDRGNSLTIGVADEHIGVVVGRGGRNLLEINQVCMF